MSEWNPYAVNRINEHLLSGWGFNGNPEETAKRHGKRAGQFSLWLSLALGTVQCMQLFIQESNECTCIPEAVSISIWFQVSSYGNVNYYKGYLALILQHHINVCWKLSKHAFINSLIRFKEYRIDLRRHYHGSIVGKEKCGYSVLVSYLHNQFHPV